MAVISGINGFVQDRECVLSWAINSHSLALQEYACSASDGAVGRTTGNEDWNGTYSAYGPVPDVLPGSFFQFRGIIAGPSGSGTKGVDSGVNGTIVDSVDIVWDIEGSGLVMHTVVFSGSASLTFGTVDSSSHPSEAIPAGLITSVGKKILFWDHVIDIPAEVTALSDLDWRRFNMTITSANQDYVSTAGAFVQRVAGNLDVSMSADVVLDDFDGLPTRGDTFELRLTTKDDESEYWQLQFMLIGEASGLEVNIADSNIVGATINASFSGVTMAGTITPTATKGTIKHEAAAGDTTVWS